MSDDLIDWLYGLQHFGIKLGLDNIRALLALLDHPERSVRALHVAGTNGKGSVSAMTDSVLAMAGIGSGLFTSPHLVRPHERIRIRGRDIDDPELQSRLGTMRDRIDRAVADGTLEGHPSFFEVITATALDAFRDHRLDAAVLEVGLGGRLDATNAIDADIGVIVSIALDHTKTLGPTLEKIAFEKAGIIKPGMRLITGVEQPGPREVIERTCRERGAELVDARRAVRTMRVPDGSWLFQTDRAAYPGVRIGLDGPHQVDNARIAIAALEALMERFDRPLSPDAVREGLADVRWPGRMQRIAADGMRPELLLDGAHNPAGLDILADHLRGLDGAPPVMLFGMTSGKTVEELLTPLADLVGPVVLTRPPVNRGLDPADLIDGARTVVDRVEAESDPAAALDRACALARELDRFVLVTGSVYLVGEILGVLEGGEVRGPVAL